MPFHTEVSQRNRLPVKMLDCVLMYFICDWQNKLHLKLQNCIINKIKIWECPIDLNYVHLYRPVEICQTAWASFFCWFAFFDIQDLDLLLNPLTNPHFLTNKAIHYLALQKIFQLIGKMFSEFIY